MCVCVCVCVCVCAWERGGGGGGNGQAWHPKMSQLLIMSGLNMLWLGPGKQGNFIKALRLAGQHYNGKWVLCSMGWGITWRALFLNRWLLSVRLLLEASCIIIEKHPLYPTTTTTTALSSRHYERVLNINLASPASECHFDAQHLKITPQDIQKSLRVMS